MIQGFPLFPCVGSVLGSPRKRAAVTPLDGCKKLRWLVRESKRRAHPGLPGAGGFRKRSEGCALGRRSILCREASGKGITEETQRQMLALQYRYRRSLGRGNWRTRTGKLLRHEGHLLLSIAGVDGRCKWRAVVADFATGFCGLINAVGFGVRCRSWGRTRTRRRRWWWWWRSGSRSAAIVSFYAV